MTGRKYDIAIVGGGLSGGLAALALARSRPDLDVLLIEAGKSLGGNHRWSWFATDLPPGGEDLLGTLRQTRWDRGYEVRFPSYRRRLRTSYRSLSSEDLDAGLRRTLPETSIRTNCPALSLDADGVTLEDGERISARKVIDCRGIRPSPHLCGGWQVFMGRYLRTNAPHHIERPIVMDAKLDQHGAYRFVYVLPLGAHELLIEDTYYADDPVLDRSALSARIDAYCAVNGWEGEITGNETGVLPVITGGSIAAYQDSQRIAGVAMAGTRGLFCHPLTSYSLPQAVEVGLTIAAEADLPGEQMAALLETMARRHWRATRFYRRLGRMLFQAARPAERWRIFQRFYRLREDLIERFYAGRSSFGDRCRILLGKPPVPMLRAMGALLSPGRNLA